MNNKIFFIKKQKRILNISLKKWKEKLLIKNKKVSVFFYLVNKIEQMKRLKCNLNLWLIEYKYKKKNQKYKLILKMHKIKIVRKKSNC